jgi:A/G-specific adenine glycosylase
MSAVSTFVKRLLRWYRRHHRRLPWRENPEPYRVWISELMLQQTQVKTVLPYFQRFMERFPNVQALARAAEDDVLAVWSGLGYYRRARALHRGARWIVQENGGNFPDKYEGWLALPGVGRYTAGAIMSIAFGQRYAILDGNVARVLSRVFMIGGDLRQSTVRKRLWQKSEEILPPSDLSDFNQALMELGALVCVPLNPRCKACPIEKNCFARRRGREAEFPCVPSRRETLKVTLAAAVVRRKNRVLMVRRDAESVMRGLWELPGGTCRETEKPELAVIRQVRERYGLELEPAREISRVKHHIMNQRITLHAFEARLRGALGPRRPSRAWVDPFSTANRPVSSMTLKVFRALASEKTAEASDD